MIRFSLALSLFIAAYYLFLHAMANEDSTKDILVNIGEKKVPLSSINKPHNVVIGGANKPVPNLNDFPPLEPQAQEAEQEAEKKTN